MKIVGRKTSAAYELYGFIPKVENGKHSAICMSCNRVLQNTAAVRMQKHRNSCLASRSSNVDPTVHIPNIEIKKRISSKDVTVQHAERINSNVKTEQIHFHFEDGNVNDNTNDNTNYEEDASENMQYYIPSLKYSPKKDRTDKLKAKTKYFKERSKYFISEIKNLKFEKTMMILKAKKLRLEIQQLENN